jgi:hypothetical protein
VLLVEIAQVALTVVATNQSLVGGDTPILFYLGEIMVTIDKTIWPPPMGASLTAKENGKIVIVIKSHPKSVSHWMGKRVTKAERKRVENAIRC